MGPCSVPASNMDKLVADLTDEHKHLRMALQDLQMGLFKRLSMSDEEYQYELQQIAIQG